MAPPLPPQYCLTGNIGSGKSTVAREFERLGIPVYYADAAARRLMSDDADLRDRLTERFGEATYVGGELNRPHLATVAFADDRALADLNALVHPAVFRDGARWKAAHPDAPYTLYEAAITLELGRARDFAAVIVVDAPEPERRRRVMARDGATAEQFAARAAKQWSDDRKRAAADHLIDNAGTTLLWPQVLGLHALLLPTR